MSAARCSDRTQPIGPQPQRRGYVFDRRFSAEPVLDGLALRDRLLYLILNPVQADLVERHEQWPGLCLFAKSEPVSHPFRRFRQDLYDAARRQTPPGQQPPNPIDSSMQ